MAISTLSKFTVPLANDQSSASQGLLMPKLQYRFRFVLENFGVSTPRSELTKQVVDCSRPNLTFDNVRLDVYNSRVYVAGKHTWDPITITVRDDVNNAVTKLVGEQVQKQFDFFEQASAASGIDYKFTSRIEILDGGKLLGLFRSIGLSVRMDTKINIQQDGKFVSLTDKLSTKSDNDDVE